MTVLQKILIILGISFLIYFIGLPIIGFLLIELCDILPGDKLGNLIFVGYYGTWIIGLSSIGGIVYGIYWISQPTHKKRKRKKITTNVKK